MRRGIKLAPFRGMLRNLLADTVVLAARGDLDRVVSGFSTDSREIAPGQIFVACPGQKVDGRAFVMTALHNGAAAIICEPPYDLDLPVPLILVPNARKALAEVASAYYGHPSRTIGLIGVTGTDGKTTTTHMTAAILRAAGLRVGFLSTVAVDWSNGSDVNRTSFTTPESPTIQFNLARMRDASAQVVVLEVSSHALTTERVHTCAFDCAVFTNLDREHLDYHGSFEEYRDAKSRLFKMLEPTNGKPWAKLGVVNGDDRSSNAMRAASRVPCLDFGFGQDSALRAVVQSEGTHGSQFSLHSKQGQITIRTRLQGRYNVLNWLAAYGAAANFGANLDAFRHAAANFSGVPGRLEPLHLGQPYNVYVDFAHTPQGLAVTLDTLRRSSSGRLIALFGQAGRRDHGNRARMAEAVACRADFAVLTTDDPYDEDPQRILNDLSAAMRAVGRIEGRDFVAILDRREAIAYAICKAQPRDCILLAGRGPEEVQVIGGERVALNDTEVARQCVKKREAA